MLFRIGVNLGDIVVENDDIFGDGVNVAARLQAIAEPGGICISGEAHGQVEGNVAASFVDLGERKLKNIAKPVRAFNVRAGGARETSGALDQEIRFCTASDGVRLAYASVGSGPPLVKAANWLSHLDHDWESPVWRHVLHALSANHRLVRYDERGNGLSDWDAEDISFEAFVRDLETVVDAAGLDRFALLGISQGCAVSIAYAVRHPERVTNLVLYGGYAVGWRSREDNEIHEALLTLVRTGWGKENPAFRQVFTSRFIPCGSEKQMRWFNELQQVTTSADNAIRILETFVRDRRSPFVGEGRRADAGFALPRGRRRRIRTGQRFGEGDTGRPFGAARRPQPPHPRRRTGVAQVPDRNPPLPRRLSRYASPNSSTGM